MQAVAHELISACIGNPGYRCIRYPCIGTNGRPKYGTTKQCMSWLFRTFSLCMRILNVHFMKSDQTHGDCGGSRFCRRLRFGIGIIGIERAPLCADHDSLYLHFHVVRKYRNRFLNHGLEAVVGQSREFTVLYIPRCPPCTWQVVHHMCIFWTLSVDATRQLPSCNSQLVCKPASAGFGAITPSSHAPGCNDLSICEREVYTIVTTSCDHNFKVVACSKAPHNTQLVQGARSRMLNRVKLVKRPINGTCVFYKSKLPG